MLSLNPEKKQKGQSNDADAHVGPRIGMRRVWLDMTQVALGSAIRRLVSGNSKVREGYQPRECEPPPGAGQCSGCETLVLV